MYSKIIPLHLQEELIQLGEDITKHTFRIGDIVVAIADFVEANKIECTKRDIWRAVGSFIGKAAGTVQGYEAIARFYPVSVRNEYEVLSSSHFRMAMQIDARTEYGWQSVLNYAVDRGQEYGRPATVDELMKVFLYGSEPFSFDDEPIHRSAINPVRSFIDLMSQLIRGVELLSIPEHTRAEIKVALAELERIFRSIEND